jgi:protein-disulfide isomerase
LQLDTATFNQCLDSDKTLSVVQADTAEATRMGVNSTPSFFVNNRPLQLKSIAFSEFSRTFDSLSK